MTIQEAIRQMANAGAEIYAKVCTVDEVDEQSRTVDCTPLDDSAPLLGVNLQANQGSKDGVVAIPVKGSYVVVAFLSPATAVVVLADQIDKVLIKIEQTTAEITKQGIVFNGGDLGGLVNINDLTNKLNDLIKAFNTHTHEIPIGSVAVSGSATAQANTAPVAVPPVSKAHATLSADDYQDDTIKH